MSDEPTVIFNPDLGKFEQGIPARNLTQDEWNEVPPETQKRLLESGLYRVAKPAKKKESE